MLHKLWKVKARAAKFQSVQVLEKECPGPQLSKIKLSYHHKSIIALLSPESGRNTLHPSLQAATIDKSEWACML